MQGKQKKRNSLLTSRAKKTLVVQQNVDKKIKMSRFDPENFAEKKEQETKVD